MNNSQCRIIASKNWGNVLEPIVSESFLPRKCMPGNLPGKEWNVKKKKAVTDLLNQSSEVRKVETARIPKLKQKEMTH